MTRAEYIKDWRAKNPEKYAEHKRRQNEKAKVENAEQRREFYQSNRRYFTEYEQKRREEIRRLRAEFRHRPCADCAGSFPPYVMEFDHRDGEVKKQNIASLRGTVKAFLDEVAKCDVVCANCHRIRTFERKQQTGEHGQSGFRRERR